MSHTGRAIPTGWLSFPSSTLPRHRVVSGLSFAYDSIRRAYRTPATGMGEMVAESRTARAQPRWTAEEDALLRELLAEDWTLATIGERIGRTAIACKYHRMALGLGRRKPPRWTPSEELRLIELLEAHKTYREIGKDLGRTEVAIIVRCHRMGFFLTTTNGRTVNAVAGLMGVEHDAVRWWVREGWLKAHRTDMRVHAGYVTMVEDDDLLAFLENPEHWHIWEPERIREYALREWATEMRAGVRYLTVGEAAQRMYVTANCVNQMIHDGRLPAVRWGNWRIREEDAVYPEPPSRKRRPRAVPWTEQERQCLADWWGGAADEMDRGEAGKVRKISLPDRLSP